jgi:hypothetical protein
VEESGEDPHLALQETDEAFFSLEFLFPWNGQQKQKSFTFLVVVSLLRKNRFSCKLV